MLHIVIDKFLKNQYKNKNVQDYELRRVSKQKISRVMYQVLSDKKDTMSII